MSTIQIETVTLRDGSKIDIIRDVESVKRALAPQHSADVLRIAEEIGKLFSDWIADHTNDCSDAAIAAILEREFAAKDAEIARLTRRAARKEDRT